MLHFKGPVLSAHLSVSFPLSLPPALFACDYTCLWEHLNLHKMPFGRKKNDTDGELDSKKASLFGSRSKASHSPAPQSANPYAAPPPSKDPYAKTNGNPYANQYGSEDAYAPRSQPSLTQPPTSSFGSLSLNSQQTAPPRYDLTSPAPNRNEKSPVPPGGYGGGPSRYPAPSSNGQAAGYAQSSGYGADPYANGQSHRGPSGYGGLGRSNSQDTVTTNAGRNALFGDAPQRVQHQQASGMQQSQDQSYSNSSGYDPGGYGVGADHGLTAEEQEDQDVKAAKNEIHFVKEQTKASSSNALRIARETEQLGIETLQRLGVQGERLHHTERTMDEVQYQAELGASKAKDLKVTDRSMFATKNPFTKTARRTARVEGVMEQHEQQKAIKEFTREQAYNSQQRQQGAQRDILGNPVVAVQAQKDFTERSKYQFEADDEDDKMEEGIEEDV